ncbi:nucleotide sugar dehydrogenase [Thermodesulfovibrio yellowstonii]|uniref:UDP-N-acetyl-D-glucosamine dehydrogenase n=1 Tax=Thermodesulfovibrio yellowstonii TaxID=28262 RepID=A0A9W6GE17_9BACT|nr:nucleotide sugar dehydrogenase [Thermodesulfovibrio islandicus]GLI52405.1 UDP-N-acetyl-D-glucosamine dehydrogenase [Thermodesulfovibrio islandicus]
MELITKIKTKQAKIGIIGLGYVGLPLVIEFCKAGFQVYGFDIDERKINLLLEGKSYIKHINNSSISEILPNFTPTTDFSRISEVDCVIICVPTPLNKYREPDLSYVFNTGEVIAKYMKKGQLIVLESTTYPGTTDEDLRKILEKSGLKAGVDFYLAYSPEREDPGNKEFSTSKIPKVVGGFSSSCLEVAKALYDQIVVRTVPVSSTKVAESVKLLENIYRAVNIALVNELKILFDRMGIDVWEVIEAAKTKPFGFQAFYPGPGLGGHCIPIDPFYLTWKAREYDFHTRFIELAGEINTQVTYYVLEKIIQALNENKTSIKGARILILGVAYKKDVDDMRESPALKLMDLLEKRGALVDYNDPYIPELPETRKYKKKKKSVELTPDNLSLYDCVVITTDHSLYDPDFIAKNSKLIIDTRNLIKSKTYQNVLKA